jgi:cell wall-associated NlpC family hydrolase
VRKLVHIRLAGQLAVGALAIFTCACASTGATPHPFPMPNSAAGSSGAGGASGAGEAAGSSEAIVAKGSDGAPNAIDGYAISGTALALRGKPYRNGGADPAGFDCSGFTQYVFAQHGVALPRAVHDQFQQGQPVKTPDLAPGDLLFFQTTAKGPTHVAIAIGGDQFVHAPSSTGVVRVERLGATYWAQRYLGARRVQQP